MVPKITEAQNIPILSIYHHSANILQMALSILDKGLQWKKGQSIQLKWPCITRELMNMIIQIKDTFLLTDKKQNCNHRVNENLFNDVLKI